MTKEEIKKYVDEFFKEMLSIDENYLDNVSESWIDEAEDWLLKHADSVTLEEGCEFRQGVRKKFDELYDEKFGSRDALLRLDSNIKRLRLLKNDFERDKHYFKKFPTYNNVVSTHFSELLEYIELMSKIEHGQVESLK